MESEQVRPAGQLTDLAVIICLVNITFLRLRALRLFHSPLCKLVTLLLFPTHRLTASGDRPDVNRIRKIASGCAQLVDTHLAPPS
jgi:hypothetical protein